MIYRNNFHYRGILTGWSSIGTPICYGYSIISWHKSCKNRIISLKSSWIYAIVQNIIKIPTTSRSHNSNSTICIVTGRLRGCTGSDGKEVEHLKSIGSSTSITIPYGHGISTWIGNREKRAILKSTSHIVLKSCLRRRSTVYWASNLYIIGSHHKTLIGNINGRCRNSWIL